MSEWINFLEPEVITGRCLTCQRVFTKAIPYGADPEVYNYCDQRCTLPNLPFKLSGRNSGKKTFRRIMEESKHMNQYDLAKKWGIKHYQMRKILSIGAELEVEGKL